MSIKRIFIATVFFGFLGFGIFTANPRQKTDSRAPASFLLNPAKASQWQGKGTVPFEIHLNVSRFAESLGDLAQIDLIAKSHRSLKDVSVQWRMPVGWELIQGSSTSSLGDVRQEEEISLSVSLKRVSDAAGPVYVEISGAPDGEINRLFASDRIIATSSSADSSTSSSKMRPESATNETVNSAHFQLKPKKPVSF